MDNRVLMVDDDRPMTNALFRALSIHFDLTIASSGAEALDLFHQGESFTVVVTDLRMPEMDGIQLIKHLREIDPELAFIILTGNSDTGTLEYIASAGKIFKTLYKPCTTKEIQTSIEDALETFCCLEKQDHQQFGGSAYNQTH